MGVTGRHDGPKAFRCPGSCPELRRGKGRGKGNWKGVLS